MYAAKSAGSGQIVWFEPVMLDELIGRMELERDLRTAIEREKLDVHFQPIVPLGTGEMIGAEALVRWQHPRRGNVSPLEFVPIAEWTGPIDQLGLFVLRHSCDEARGWHGDRFVSVNVAPRQLLRADFAVDVRWIVHEVGLEPARLVVDVTESAVMDEGVKGRHRRLDVAETAVAGLRGGDGDDFGSGYSSLGLLRQLSIHTLKIDRAFLNDPTTDHGAHAYVQANWSTCNASSVRATTSPSRCRPSSLGVSCTKSVRRSGRCLTDAAFSAGLRNLLDSNLRTDLSMYTCAPCSYARLAC